MPAPNTPPAATVEADLAAIDAALQQQTLDSLADSAAAGTPTKPAATSGEPEHNYEYEARRKGWRPEAEYTGPQGSWVDAKTFVQRGERFTKKLEAEITTLKSKIESFEGTKAQFRKFFDEQMAKRDKEHSEAVTALRLQLKAAVREGDDELALELEDRIDATRKQQATLKAEAEQAATDRTPTANSDAPVVDQSPVLQEWIAEGNDWFQQDEVLTKHAIAIGKQMRADGEKALGRSFLEKVKAQVMADFPRRFKDAGAAGARNVTTEGAGQSGTGAANSAGYNGKTERDLPAEDLALMRQFVKDGLYTKEQFLKSYFSRNG